MDKIRRIAYITLGAGGALLYEHVIVYGSSIDEIFCHGFYGFIMLLLGVYLLLNREFNVTELLKEIEDADTREDD